MIAITPVTYLSMKRLNDVHAALLRCQGSSGDIFFNPWLACKLLFGEQPRQARQQVTR